MHARLFVLFDKEEAEKPEDACVVADTMLECNGFAGHSGLFSESPSDWYVIGGRWSGALVWAQLGYEHEGEFWKKAEQEGIDGIPFVEGEVHKKLRRIFREMFPDYPADKPEPVARDCHSHYEDDAMTLDEPLAKFLSELKRYPSETNEVHDGDAYVDLSDPWEDYKLSDALGKKWLVVVDFHY
jgi:hypothetical protein